MNPGGEGWAERLNALTYGRPRDLLPFPERDFQLALAASRSRAPAQCRRLRALAPEVQERRCERYRSYRSWGLAELLCRESIHQASRDPSQAVHLAYLASLIAMALFEDPPPWTSHARAMLLAVLTFAHLGNAHRVADDLPLAREVFDGVAEGRKALAGHPDPLGYLPRVLELEASLLRAQRQLPEALAALKKLIAHYRRRDPHRAARAMVKAAKTYEEMRRLPEALDLVERAAPLVDQERDPDLSRALLHNRTYYLAAMGRTAEAQSLMPRLQEAFGCEPGSLDAIRMDWLQAQIEMSRGDRARARTLLQRAQKAFTEAGLTLDAALVTLELACLAAREGDSDEVRRLAREQLPLFEEHALHREALAALRLLRYAALEERTDRALLEELRHWLRRARQNPRYWLENLPLRDAWRPQSESWLDSGDESRAKGLDSLAVGWPRGPVAVPERDFALALAESRARAAAQWRRLSALDREAQVRRCEDSHAFHSWGLAELLCRESIHQASRNPVQSVHLAHLACLITIALLNDPPPWATHAHTMLLALLAFAHLGNALRVNDDLPLARGVFDAILEGRRALAGHPDPLDYLPRVVQLETSLLRAQGHLPEALVALEELIAYYRGRAPHRAARAMVNAAKIYEGMHRMPEALELVEQAGALVDHHRHPALARAVLHNRTYYLAAMGRTAEAQAQMPRLRKAFGNEPASLDAIRLDWLQAQVELGRGERARAQVLLQRAREAFLQSGLSLDADLVALELACLAAGTGDPGKPQGPAHSHLSEVQQQTLHRKALAALRPNRQVASTGSKAALPKAVDYCPRVLDLLACLRRAQWRFPENPRGSDRVLDHRQPNDRHHTKRADLHQAITQEDLKQLTESLVLKKAATELLDLRTDSELASSLLHNRTYYLAALRRAANAAALLPRVRKAFNPEAGSLDAFRVDWIEARIAEGLGDRPRARWLLEKVRNRFTRAGLAFDAALAALELACLAAEDSDAPELRRIARTLIPVFEGQQVHLEALAALRLFHYGALEERIDQDLVRSVYDYLRKARHDPDLKFAGGQARSAPDPEGSPMT